MNAPPPSAPPPSDLVRRSLNVVWHPCTQMKDHEWLPLVPVAKAEGVWLETPDGHRILDAVSSWWTNIFGHRHPVITDHVRRQLDTLDHVMLAGFTHEPVVALSEQLVALTPGNLSRCCYTDNGSSAVEVALKMSHHYWRNVGKPEKTRFATLGNSYHGETLGALAVGDTGLYRDTYAPLLLTPITLPSPDCSLMVEGGRGPGESWEDYSRRRFADARRLLEAHADTLAAVIVEPLLQCAGGMRMYHAAWLTLLREACDELGIHFIADEIATGFGRTGQMFGCQHAGVTPDFMCLSKGLTGGTLPLAVTLTNNTVYEAFYDDYGTGKAFLHSHSYTGNPLACAAALGTLAVFAECDWMAINRGLGQLMWTQTAALRRHPHVAEVRQQGMVLAAELAQAPHQRQPYPAHERRGLRAYQYALEKGVLLRPLGNTLYLMPPYVITAAELGRLCEVLTEAVDVATQA
jgi:adenosylmethionine---8-amino-7-oxononanoate aminotransferase